MPKRNRAAERKRSERLPDLKGWQVEPVGVIVQTEEAWKEKERTDDDDD